MNFYFIYVESLGKYKKYIYFTHENLNNSSKWISKCKNARNVEIIGECGNVIKKFNFEKNIHVQLMSFYYINVEAIGKCKKKW